MLTRREVVRYGSVSAGMLAAAQLVRTGPPPSTPVLVEGTTLESTIVRGAGSGYRRLVTGPPQPAVLRTDLASAHQGRADRRTAMATVVQVSDLHITDVQSPMRFEYLDRHCRTAHRPQELLGTHGATALVRRINGLRGGPFTGRPVDAVMTTGDNTDNQNSLELEWLLTVLAGGTVRPTSGDPSSFEGVAASGLPDYWQPEGVGPDRYTEAGFPFVPGLLRAAAAPFDSPGLRVPWLLTMGNHDDTALGTLGPHDAVAEWCTAGRKIFSARSDMALRLGARLRAPTAAAGARLGVEDLDTVLSGIARAGQTRTVTADDRRRPFTGAEYVAALHEPRFAGAGPVGHGYRPDADGSELYYTHWLAERVLAISLDTTNQAGGAQGSIGTAQLKWLRYQLVAHRDAYIVVFSHHPSYSMTNVAPDPRDPGEERHEGGAVLQVLLEHPNVVAWVNGHSHSNRITPWSHSDPRRSFWEINTVSHVDAPQQARVLEVATNGDGTVSVFTTLVDSASPVRAEYDELTPAGLASLYRELAFNDLDLLERGGSAEDGNTELLLVDPMG